MSEAAYKEHDSIGQGHARELMLCRKKAVKLCLGATVVQRGYTTLFICIKCCRSYWV